MESRQTLLIGTLLIVVLLIGTIVGATLVRPAQAQAGVGGLRQVTVFGRGEVRVTPDMATVQIGVETNAPTTQEALAQNSAQVQALIERVRQLGIAERDVQTSGFNIYPTYDQQGRSVTGYTVSNMVLVTIRDLDQAGALLDQVVQAGANRVYGVSFGISDPAKAEAQARTAAMQNARERAEQLAQSGNANLGAVLVISEAIGNGPIVPLPAMMSDKVAEGGMAVPVQAGEQVISLQIQVTYELR